MKSQVPRSQLLESLQEALPEAQQSDFSEEPLKQAASVPAATSTGTASGLRSRRCTQNPQSLLADMVLALRSMRS